MKAAVTDVAGAPRGVVRTLDAQTPLQRIWLDFIGGGDTFFYRVERIRLGRILFYKISLNGE